MILQCPSCRPVRIAANHTGRKVCTSVGTVAGAALGDFVDENILDNFECMECGDTFSVDTD